MGRRGDVDLEEELDKSARQNIPNYKNSGNESLSENSWFERNS